VSPIRNEVAHLEAVIRAVAAQQLLPARWIVVDDGSSDGTAALARRLAADIAFMDVLVENGGSAGRDPLAEGAESKAFNRGLALADVSEFTHVMKLDGDVELPPDYLRRLMAEFANDPGLGIACGDLVEGPSENRARIPIPAHHVHGALKCYTLECFQAIGGIQERLGWDTIDETYARMRGFRTRSFRDFPAMHHRALGSASGTLRGRARHGECAYVAHFSPLWVFLRAVKVAQARPVGLTGVAFLYGYVRAAVGRVDRVPDPDFRRFARWELRQRMLRSLHRTPPRAQL
jgi:poly-beta-1,6-N-acetyl-D-glucosamine synthase